MRLFLWVFVVVGLVLILVSLASNMIEPAISEFLLASGLTVLILGVIFLILNSMVSVGNLKPR